MGCPECGAANFLGLDILCPTCVDKVKETVQEPKERYLVLRAGDFIEEAEDCDDLSDAEDKALMHSIDDNTWLVCDTDGDVISIAYGRELYSK